MANFGWTSSSPRLSARRREAIGERYSPDLGVLSIDMTDVRECVVLGTTTPVPGAPPPVIGVMNLRGNVLPVVDARPLLGLPVLTRGDRALVLAEGERRAAVIIEGVLGLAALDDVQPPPAEAGEPAGWGLAAETSRATLLDARAMLGALRRGWEPVPGG